MAVLKLFKTLMRFINAEYYKGNESVLNGLEIVLNEKSGMLYIVDIVDYIVIADSWGIGVVKLENFLFNGYNATVEFRESKGWQAIKLSTDTEVNGVLNA